MKKGTIITIGIIILILVIGAVSVYMYQKDKVAVVAVRNFCFQKTVFDETGTSSTSIGATLNPNHTVGGELYFLPSQKDSLYGTFTGTWQANGTTTELNVIQSYVAEGITATATRTITIANSYALIDWDGKGSASTSDEHIPQVDCAQVK